MATYNGARYIREQLDSLAAQTLLPYELVVTDDGSTDTTLEIVRNFSGGALFPVRIHRNENRLGYADNFLYAASLCKGNFIAFCDQDDVWMPEKLATCASAFDDPNVLLVVHVAQVTGSDLAPTGEYFPKINSDQMVSRLEGNPWRSALGFSMIFRVSLLDGFDVANRPCYRYASPHPILNHHDTCIYFIAHSLGTVAFLATPLASYRRHESNNSHGVQSKSWREYLASRIYASEDYYAHAAMAVEQRIEVLKEIKYRSLDPEVRARAENACAHWGRFSSALIQRVELHSYRCGFTRRLSILASLALEGNFRAVNKGGFGVQGLLKDFIFGLFARHRTMKDGTETIRVNSRK